MTRLRTLTIGSKFTLWKVVEKLFHKDDNGYQQYVCECTCGTKDIVRGTDLYLGRSLGCKPCVATLPLAGLRVGTWKIVHQRTERSSDRGNHIEFDCVCECGFERVIKGTHLRNGRFVTCPSCKVRETEKISADAVAKGKASSEEFSDRRNRAKNIFESNISVLLKIVLLERFLDLLQRRLSFFMIELNGDKEEFDNYCKQLETTYNYITELKKSLTVESEASANALISEVARVLSEGDEEGKENIIDEEK